MSFWLEKDKKSDFNPSSDMSFVDVRNLNRNQNLAYKVVENHFRNSFSNPIFVMITGQGGSGKSFALGSFCIVIVYFLHTLALLNLTLELRYTCF